MLLYKLVAFTIAIISTFTLVILLICSNLGIIKGATPRSLLKEEPILLFSNNDAIGGLCLKTMSCFMVRKAVKSPTVLDVDPLEARIYWVEPSNASTIYSSKVDGSDLKVALKHGLMLPLSIAVDYVAKNLYIADLELYQILVCKMEGTMCHVLHNIDDRNAARSIALDLTEGMLYWSEYGTGKSPAGIYRSGMDGSRRSVLVSRDISCPNGVTIDLTTNRIYWVDECLSTLEYINLGGTERKVLIKEIHVLPYSLTVLEANLYWSDLFTEYLKISNKFLGNVTTLNHENVKLGVYASHIYHPGQAIQRGNPCRSNTCSHMCLMAPSNGYKCVCPPGFLPAADAVTCKLDDSFPVLFVNDESNVYQIQPKTAGSDGLKKLPVTLVDQIGRIAYDWRRKTLYLADTKTPAIYAVILSTLVRRDFVKSNITEPKDLAFDWTSGNLYWVDSSKGTVEVKSTMANQRTSLIAGLTKPSAIALVPKAGLMFISTGGEGPAIAMYNMDGSNRVVLEQIFAVALAVQPSASLLYWADPQSESISYLDYESPESEPKIFRRFANAESVAVSDEYVYWTENHVLNYQNHNGHHRPFTVTLPRTQGQFSPTKVIFSTTTTDSVDFPCLLSNGGCSHLCLTVEGGRTCACTTGMVLSEDVVSCKEGS